MPLGLFAPATALLAQHLDAGPEVPIAVGFSGGSDSLAALIAVLDLAKAQGRRVLALTVDHDLQPRSRAWTAHCAQVAAGLGADPISLIWADDRPSGSSSLPARARDARHRLLALTARQHGAKVLVLGHTKTDRAESDWMRDRGTNLGQLRTWSPSPAWPEGRGVFVLRPLLDMDREALRTVLTKLGHGWIEDPANLDLRYGRSRARKALTQVPQAPAPASVSNAYWPTELGPYMPLGALCLDRQALRQAPEGASAFLARALLCVGGTQKTVRGDSLARLEAQLRAETEFAATLSGVKVSANDRSVWLVREGPRSGQALNTILQDQVWDGRFEVHGLGEGARLALLKGYAKALSPSERAWLVALPAQLRQSLPVVLTPGKAPSLPQFVGGPELTETNGVLVRSLVRPRLMAACGQIRTEKDLMI